MPLEWLNIPIGHHIVMNMGWGSELLVGATLASASVFKQKGQLQGKIGYTIYVVRCNIKYTLSDGTDIPKGFVVV